MRLAVLDDYQGYAVNQVDWSTLPGVTVVSFRDHVHDPDLLVARLQGFDAVMRIRERTEFPREVLERLPDLRLFLCTGMRNARSIDLPTCDRLGITVCTTDALHQTTVELTIWLIIALMRGLRREIDSVRAGGWQIGTGTALNGRTLGVVGLGNMGIPVARICQLMGMEVIAWSRNLTQERAAPHGVTAVTKEELFRRADIVTLHLPHSDTTERTVGATELAWMKPGAKLVNTARPKLLDEAAVLEALRSGRLGGLGLDVFEVEPLPLDHPFRHHPAVVATPHIGFVVEQNLRMFFDTTIGNIRAWQAGRPVNTISGAQPYLPDSQVAQQMHKQKLAAAGA